MDLAALSRFSFVDDADVVPSLEASDVVMAVVLLVVVEEEGDEKED